MNDYYYRQAMLTAEALETSKAIRSKGQVNLLKCCHPFHPFLSSENPSIPSTHFPTKDKKYNISWTLVNRLTKLAKVIVSHDV